jgi:hypothetical protein
MQDILLNLQGYIGPVLSLLVQFLIIVLASITMAFVKKKLKQAGIEINSTIEDGIYKLVEQVVLMLNQTVVDSIKAASSNGKLTDKQQEDIYNTALDLLAQFLTEEQVQYITSKYGNINEGMHLLIQSTIAKYKKDPTKKDVLGLLEGIFGNSKREIEEVVSPTNPVDIKSKTEVEFDPSVTTVYGDTIQTNCTESNTICTTTPLVGTIVEEPDNNDQMNSSEETI